MPSFFKSRAQDILRRKLGVDRAIASSTTTQLIRFITGPLTMLLIIRHLTPEEQGFFYSFAGVVGFQIFLEAGFAQSITQFSSREFAKLRFNREGFLVGNRSAHSRLRSIFHKANRYYTLMASILTVVLSIGGYLFFSSRPSLGVPWLIPWFVVSICAGLGFLLTPIWAVLEGCNRVAEVAAYRFWSTLVGFATSATGLWMGLGIHVAAWTSIVSFIFPIVYLTLRWRPFIRQIFLPAGDAQISWGREIWAFQWRTALAWAGGYILSSAIPLLAFRISGPAVAGQVGMAIQITRMGCGIATSWTATKIPYLGTLHAKGARNPFNESWVAGAKRHIFVAFGYQAAFMIGIMLLPDVYPAAAARFPDFAVCAGFSVGTAFASIILIYAHYCRACRVERFMGVNICMALGVILGAIWLGPSLGVMAIAISFAFVHILAAAMSRSIWSKQQHRFWGDPLVKHIP